MFQPQSTSSRTDVTWTIVRSAVATVIVILAFIGTPIVDPFVASLRLGTLVNLSIKGGLALIALVAGVVAIRGWLKLFFARLDRQAALVLKNLLGWALYGCLALAVLTMLGINLSGLLVGGAILGVIVGAAAQSSLGNFFAGLLLMLARPFEVGVTLRVRTQIAAQTEFEGTVVDTTAFFTTLRTFRGELVRLPNQLLMNSALTVGKPPLQGTLQTTVPVTLSLTTLRKGIHERLGDRGAEVIVTPMSVDIAAQVEAATVLCQIDVRSRKAVDAATLTEAVAAASASAAASQPV